MVDKIVVLSDGQVADFGTYEELISRDGAFAQFLKSFLEQEDDSDNEEDEEGNLFTKIYSDTHITVPL